MSPFVSSAKIKSLQILYLTARLSSISSSGVFRHHHEREFVIVKAGVEQSGLGDRIRAWAHGKLAHYKVPSRFFAVDEFPLTVSGKVQKFELRRRLGCEPSQ